MKKWLKRALLSFSAFTMCITFGVGAACSGKKSSCAHEWIESKVLVAATCEGDGKTEFTCTKCNRKKEETVQGGHMYVDTVYAATCKAMGYTDHTCSRCGDSYKDNVTEMRNHSYETDEVKKATCTTDGYTSYTCGGCGKSYSDVTAYATGHKVAANAWKGTETLVSGCLYHYTETADCSICQEKQTVTEEIHKHEYNVTITQAASCVSDGKKQYSCKHCDESTFVEPYSDANAHAWVEQGTANGVVTYVCDNDGCEATKTAVAIENGAEVAADTLKSAKEVAVDVAKLELENASALDSATNVSLSVGEIDETAKNSAADKIQDEEKKETFANATVYDFNMLVDGAALEDGKLGGKIKVTVPYTLADNEDPDNIVVWYIADNGDIEEMPATYSNGFATFETDHFSMYSVVRLTAAQRCRVYGHTIETKTVEGDCTTDGYIFETCKVCHAPETTKRTVTAVADGHDYTATVHAPTCSAEGYTEYTCNDCGNTYMSDRVDTIAHVYGQETFEPTCTAKGYTLYTCSVCSESYSDNIVAAKGHAYKNGECSVCGTVDPNETKVNNFYFNLLESLGNVDTVCVEIKELDFQHYEYDGRYKSVYDIKITDLKLEIGQSDKGAIGKGEGAASVTETNYESNGTATDGEAYSGSAKLVMQDGKAYVTVKYVENNTDREMTIYVDQEKLLAGAQSEDGMPTMAMLTLSLFTGGEQMDAMLDELGVTSIVESIKAVADSPFNRILEKITEYVFTKTETATGYQFSINFERLNEVFDHLVNTNLNELFDLVFGEGAFDKTVKYLNDSLNKTIAQLEQEFIEKAMTWGVNIGEVYDLIDFLANNMSGMTGGNGGSVNGGSAIVPNPDYSGGSSDNSWKDQEDAETEVDTIKSMAYDEESDEDVIDEDVEMGEFNIREMLAEYREMTLLDLLRATSDGEEPMPEEEAKEMISQMAESFKQTTAWAMIASTYGELDPASIAEMIDGIVTMLEETNLTFTTDDFGNLLTVTVKADLETMTEEEANEALSSGDSEFVTRVVANGSINVTMNGSYIGTYADAINKSQGLKAALNFKESTLLYKEKNYSQAYAIVDVKDGETYLWDNYRYNHYQEKLGEELYQGILCTKYSMTFDGSLGSADTVTAIMAIDDCTGWKEYSVSFFAYKTVTATVWVNESGLIVGIDLGDSELAVSSEMNNAYFFYNEKAGKYVTYDYDKNYSGMGMHNYKLQSHKDPEGCEGQGYNKYTCSVCGHNYTDVLVNGHEYDERYELLEGSTSCEDGYKEVLFCSVCDKILGTWTGGSENYHPMGYSEKVLATGALCGDLTVNIRECPCGEGDKELSVDNKLDALTCEFDRVNEYYDETKKRTVYTYACSVEHLSDDNELVNCGYTYTREYWSAEVGCKYYEYNYFVFPLADGTTFTYLSYHWWWSHDTVDQDPDENTYKWVCQDCGKITEWYKWVSNDQNRTIYYAKYDFETGEIEYGYSREWDGCAYVETDLVDGDTHSGVEHGTYQHYYIDDYSCTQYRECKHVCVYCGEASSYHYHAPDGHRYQTNDNGEEECAVCGTKAAYGDGNIILEDMDTEDTYKIGWFNPYEYNIYDIHFMVNLDFESVEGVELEGVSYSHEQTGYSDGEVYDGYYDYNDWYDEYDIGDSYIYTVDMESLASAISALEGVNVESLAMVVEVHIPKSNSYNQYVFELDLEVLNAYMA